MFQIFLQLSMTFVVLNCRLVKSSDFEKCFPTVDMLDASGKLPSGIKLGNVVDLGSFDECLSIEEIRNKELVKGKYCLVKSFIPVSHIGELHQFFIEKLPQLTYSISNSEQQQNRAIFDAVEPSNTSALILGWCIPNNCPLEEFIDLVTRILAFPKGTIKPLLNTGFCQVREDLLENWSAADLVVICFLIIVFLVIICSTIYDFYSSFRQQEPVHLLTIAFSIKTNGKNLLAVSSNPNQLPCLHGIRFLSMLWIILGHRYAVTFLEPVINFLFVEQWERNFQNMFIINAPISVDTFFVLSGLLLTYGIFIAREKCIKFNIISFYLHRYLRLTPALAVVVLIHATILDRFGSGPFWPFLMTQLKDFCVEYWWSTLIYVQNYYNTASLCINQTWYLSIDMQLYILSPLLLIPLWRWPRATLCFSGILLLVSVIVCGIISWEYDLPGFTIGAITNGNYNTEYYYVTHTRYGSWLIGFIFGYYVYYFRKQDRCKIPLYIVYLGWLTAIAVMLLTIFGGYNLLFEHNRLSLAVFNGLHRQAWSLSLCWVIFACTQGYGGLINTFLSLPIFQILGRFTYSMYLIHLSVQYMSASTTRTNTYFSTIATIHEFAGDLFFTLFLGLCLTLAFESPILVIEKLLFSRNLQKRNSSNNALNLNDNEVGQVNEGFAKYSQ